MKKFLAIFFVLVFCGNVISQEKWSIDPRLSVKPPIGKYVKLPYVPWENPNKQTIYYDTPTGVLAVAPNFRVLPNSNQQDEIILVSNPAFPMLLFGSANTTAGSTFSQGVYVSTNGGLNWYGNDVMQNCPVGASDPAPAIDKNGTFVFTTLNTAVTNNQMIGQYSTNYGVNWSSPFNIPGGTPSDKNLTGTDDVPTSPYYGRTYTAWSYTSGTWHIRVSYTTNGGVTWSSAQQINSPSTNSQGADVCIGPGGVVYVCWSKQSSVSIGVGLSKSTNGGTTWNANETIFNSGGIRDNYNFNGWGVRVNDFPRMAIDKSGGTRNGWIYIVDAQKNLSPAGSDADIILHKSTDGGTTWSSGVRVNQDALNNGKVQFFPCVCVDANGGVNVLYYDNRNYPSVADSCETYMSRSTDGGNTWADIKVSDHRWKPAIEPGITYYMGDYIGITYTNGKIWPFWFDNKTGTMQAWTAPIDVGPSISHTPLGNTEQISGARTVSCVITPSGSGINPSTAKLYYAKNSTSWTQVNLTHGSGDNWSGDITLSGIGIYNYYLTATDSLARTVTSPAGAPTNYYSFSASSDTTKPVITHTALTNLPKSLWPPTVSATVTDNIGIDSVWVRWYKNSTSNYKQFKLNFASGNVYSAIFNSVGPDVTLNDSIFYRIIAQDNSSNHNRDSTTLYKFKIISLVMCENFSGGVVPPTNWTVSGSYWLYATASAYGSGTGSAEFNYWSATSGTNEYLTSLTFDASLAGDSLKFDIAHALYNSAIDSLIIETSTNAGTSYASLARMYAGSSYTTLLCMSTTASTSQFTPTSSQWKSRAFILPTGTNKVRFLAKSAYGNNLYIDNICQSLITGVNPLQFSQIPEVYSLKQNYPNPFNPVTKISFDIPKQGLVSLRIYDVLGREVRTLVNEVKTPGAYSIDFNASELSSGIYFYKIETNGFSDIKKMMLIK